VGGTVVVNEASINQPPVAKFDMSAQGKSAKENETLTLTVSPGATVPVSFTAQRSYDPDGSITAYDWKGSGNTISTSRDFTFSLGKGTHQILLTVTDNGGATGSVGGTVVVNESGTNQPPVALFDMSAQGKSAKENETLTLTVAPGATVPVSFTAQRSYDPDGSITAYDWKGSGNTISTSRDFTFSLGKGTHQILLTVTDNGGATGSIGATIVVNESVTAGFTVSGTVYYSTTPLSGIKVDLTTGGQPPFNTLKTTTSSANGSYSFSSVAPGSYMVKVYGPDETYIEWTAQSITVTDSNIVLNMDLPKLITLNSPSNGAEVISLKPILTWTANPQATSYTVQLNVTSDWALIGQWTGIPAPTPPTAPSFQVPTALTPGWNYTWQVDAYDGSNHHVGTTHTAFTFTVVLVPLTPEINLKQGTTNIHDNGSYDFGSHVTGTNTDITFAVENTGGSEPHSKRFSRHHDR